MNNELNVRQGIKSKGKMVKPLIFVKGEEDVRALDFDPFEQSQKVWKKDSSAYNKMKQLTVNDVTGDDQYNKCQAVRIQFANMIYYHINNLTNALRAKYTDILYKDEKVSKIIEEYKDKPYIVKDKIERFLGSLNVVFGRYNWLDIVLHSSAGPEMCLDINTYFTHDETIIDDMTIMLSGVIANKILTNYYDDEFAGIVEEYRKNYLREVYDGLYLIFCKAYSVAAQYHAYAMYPAIEEKRQVMDKLIQEQLEKVKEENKEEDK